MAMADGLQGRLTFAQIFGAQAQPCFLRSHCAGTYYGQAGMGNSLTSAILELLTSQGVSGFQVGGDPAFVLKYFPFGSVEEVLPYLGRRAQGNSVLFQTGS